MTSLEILAASFGLASVALTVRASVWCWPVGLVSVLAYAALFVEIKLYADASLQLFYVVTGIYGWWHWGSAQRPISELSVRQRYATGGVVLVSAAAAGSLFAAFTDASVPYLDSLVAGLSITAQLLLMRKKRETWAYWIAVDVLSIGLYLYKGIYLTTGLYGIFLVMAVQGQRAWSTGSSSANFFRRTPDISSSSAAPRLPAGG